MDLIKTYGKDFDGTFTNYDEITQITQSDSPVLFTTISNSTDATNEVSELMCIYETLLDKEDISSYQDHTVPEKSTIRIQF